MTGNVWVLATSFYASKWREWLDRRRAPELPCWAETRRETCPRRDISTVAYRLPSRLPPREGDDAARAQVFDFIRFRMTCQRRSA